MSGINPNAWNNWYHCMGGTYGAWLRGDSRGFRTFDERFHVEGDYKNPPPPGVYTPMFDFSQKKLRYPPVRLSKKQQKIICRAMHERLSSDGVELIALAVATTHFHLLARFGLVEKALREKYKNSLIKGGRDPAPRHYLGMAKKHASYALSEAGCKPPEVWGRRPRCEPIRDRQHQVNTYRYIVRHVCERAAVYSIKDGYLFDE